MSSNPRPKIKASHLRRVTPETRFYIDYDWWDESNLDLKTYLYTRWSVPEDSSSELDAEKVDLVDSRTGAVRQVDAFQYIVQSTYKRHADDGVQQGSLVDMVFGVLLANDNQPLTMAEIAAEVERPTDLLLRTFGGSHIYNGIRPLFDD